MNLLELQKQRKKTLKHLNLLKRLLRDNRRWQREARRSETDLEVEKNKLGYSQSAITTKTQLRRERAALVKTLIYANLTETKLVLKVRDYEKYLDSLDQKIKILKEKGI